MIKPLLTLLVSCGLFTSVLQGTITEIDTIASVKDYVQQDSLVLLKCGRHAFCSSFDAV